MKVKTRNSILWVVLIIPYLILIPAYYWHKNKINEIKNSSFIIINKEEMQLYHYNYEGVLLQKSPIACGKNYGNKVEIGDNKTPEGVFTINQVEDASSWTHDFKDDEQGEINGAYGPYFIRLNVPGQKGIGIHGTHDPRSIGNRASEGCVRMKNEDLRDLVSNIKTALVVIITPSKSDLDSTYFKKIIKVKIRKEKK